LLAYIAPVPNPARAALTLHFGDELTALGPTEGLKATADELGNSTEQLNQHN